MSDSTFNKLVYDENELKKFYDILSPLSETESYFVSLSARNKYLTKEEKDLYNLNKTRMIHRKLIRHNRWEYFLSKIYSFETNIKALITNNNMIIPNKCLIIYFTIHPIDMIKTSYEYINSITSLLQRINMNSINNKDNTSNFKQLKKLDIMLYNTMPNKGFSNKYFIDIDCDINKEDKVELNYMYNFITELSNNNILFHIISTKSGFHILLKHETIQKKLNIKEIIDKYDNFIEKEIIINKNASIPLPGTLQMGHPVKLLSDPKEIYNI